LDAFYEDLPEAVNISLDDVGVPKQKLYRKRSDLEETAPSPTDKEQPPEASSSHSILGPDDPALKRVHNTVAHVETPDGHYILNGHGRVTVLRLLIAFLLYHDLLRDHCVQFFVDGARSFHADILAHLHGFRPMRTILDGYHLLEKGKVERSLVLREKSVRNPVLADLMPWLWLGPVDAAIAYLRTLGSDQMKAGKSVDRLIEYFERNRQ